MDYGTDIKSDWSFNENGDLVLVSDVDNLFQAIVNRLTCSMHNLRLFYADYGCLVNDFLGWKRTERTLNFIKLELQNRLDKEERLESFNVETSFDNDGKVLVKLDLISDSDYVHSIELKLSEDGVEEIGD